MDTALHITDQLPRGSILVGVLWCLALLSVMVMSVLFTARLDLRMVKNYGDVIQARYLALAGIEKAKALIYQDAKERKRSRQNHSGSLYDAPGLFRDVSLGRGQFRVFHQAPREEGGQLFFGVTDEEARLNVNTASAQELGKLPEMTPDIVAAILDWRDADNAPSAGGAEAEYYLGSRPPYVPRNGPLQTATELLMVRGVTPELFLGRNMRPSAGEDSTPGSESGWSSLLTVSSSVRNVDAAGEDRVNIQTADQTALSAVPGITADIAKAIVAGRNRNRLESLADLLDVQAVQPGDEARPAPSRQPDQPAPDNAPPPDGQSAPPPAPPPASTGAKLISEDLLQNIADELTVESGREQAGPVNINTAPAPVLACLPGVDLPLAQAIVAYRESAGFFPNIAGLLKVSGMNRQIFKQLAPRVSARSETYRILSEGKVKSTGARQRIQVICRMGTYDFETLSYREGL